MYFLHRYFCKNKVSQFFYEKGNKKFTWLPPTTIEMQVCFTKRFKFWYAFEFSAQYNNSNN